MSTAPIGPLTLTGFEVTPRWNGPVLELVLTGNADMTVSGALKSYLRDLDVVAQSRGTRSVQVKLAELYFFSSSCFQALASWLSMVAAREGKTRYVVTFETHPAQPWQKRSLEALRRMAPDVIVVV